MKTLMKYKNKCALIIAILFAFTFSVFFVSQAKAEEKSSSYFSVSPMNQKFEFNPGETYTGTISISNPNVSKVPLYYSVESVPFSVNDETYSVNLIKENSYNQIKDWITIENPTGKIEPNTSADINFTIKIPQDAPAGGQYAALKVSKNVKYDEAEDNSVGVQNYYSIASIIYAKVNGTTREEVKVLENDIPFFNLSAPIKTTSLVENTGNVHETAKYTLQVYQAFSDEEIYTNEEDEVENVIMPDSKRFVTQTWEKAPSIGIFKVRQTVEILDQRSIEEKIIIICPLWVIFVVIFVIILAISYIVVRAKNRKNRLKCD